MVEQKAVLLALILVFICPYAGSDNICPTVPRKGKIIKCSDEGKDGGSCYDPSSPVLRTTTASTSSSSSTTTPSTSSSSSTTTPSTSSSSSTTTPSTSSSSSTTTASTSSSSSTTTASTSSSSSTTIGQPQSTSSNSTGQPPTTRDPVEVLDEMAKLSDMNTTDPNKSLADFGQYSVAFARLIFTAKNVEEKKKIADEVEKVVFHVANAVLSEIGAGKGNDSALAIMMHYFEDVGPALASALPMGDSKTSSTSGMEMVLHNADLKTSRTVNVKGTDNDVSFEPLLPEGSSSLSVSLISVAGNVSTALNNLQIVGQPQDDRGYKPRLNTDIVTVSASVSVLKLNVSVGFKLLRSQGLASPICVSITKEPSGSNLSQLDASGCTTKTKDANHIVCSCNHLSSFAILMSVTHTAQVAQSTDSTLELLSTLCLSLSIAFLAISFITFCSFKNLQSDRNTIHMNLSACLLLGQLLFLVAIDQTANKVGCAVIAGILHFLFLATFCWMANEGMHIYLKLVLVFEPTFSIVPYLYGVGYGPPILIVVVTAIAKSDGYGIAHACWLKTEEGFIYSFVGPVCVVAFFDFVMLVIAISVMVRHSRNSNKKDLSALERYRGWLKGSCALLSVLGITWVFGIFSFGDPGTVVFAYIFNLLNGAQGVTVFIFHCYLNEKVRKEYRRVLRKMTWLPDPVQRCFTGLCRTRSTTDLGGMSSSTGKPPGTLTQMLGSRVLKDQITQDGGTAMTLLQDGPEEGSGRPATAEEAGIYLGSDPNSKSDPSVKSLSASAAGQVVLVSNTAGGQPPPQPKGQDLPPSLEPSLVSTDSRRGTKSPTGSIGSSTVMSETGGLFSLFNDAGAAAADEDPE